MRIDLKRMDEGRLRAVASLLENEYYEQRSFVKVMEEFRDQRRKDLVWAVGDLERRQGYCQALEDVCILITGAGAEIRDRQSRG